MVRYCGFKTDIAWFLQNPDFNGLGMVDVTQCHAGFPGCWCRILSINRLTRYTLEGLLWLEHPQNFQREGLMMFPTQIEGCVLFGSCSFSQGISCVKQYANMLSTSCPLVSKESGDSRWYHQKVDNLWLQIYLSSCFEGEFEWIGYNLTTCNDWHFFVFCCRWLLGIRRPGYWYLKGVHHSCIRNTYF